jgi:predicted DNA-binding transcriptional regulator AlpA
MPRGGKRSGAGRPRGSRNKITLSLLHWIRQSKQPDLLSQLSSVANNRDVPIDVRLDALRRLFGWAAARIVSASRDQPPDISEVPHALGDSLREAERDQMAVGSVTSLPDAVQFARVVRKRVSIPDQTVWQWMEEGGIPRSVLVNGTPQWREADVEAWVKERAREALEPALRAIVVINHFLEKTEVDDASVAVGVAHESDAHLAENVRDLQMGIGSEASVACLKGTEPLNVDVSGGGEVLDTPIEEGAGDEKKVGGEHGADDSAGREP